MLEAVHKRIEVYWDHNRHFAQLQQPLHLLEEKKNYKSQQNSKNIVITF